MCRNLWVTIQGTPEADTIVLVQGIRQSQNYLMIPGWENKARFIVAPLSEVEQVVVEGFGGDDRLINTLSVLVKLIGGDGNDWLHSGRLDDELIGGAGFDRIGNVSHLEIVSEPFPTPEGDADPPLFFDANDELVKQIPVVIAEAASNGGTVLTFDELFAKDNGINRPVTYSHPSGSVFPIGTTVVTVSSSDVAGNTATLTFEVIVRDLTTPVLSGVPSEIVIEATSPDGAFVTFGLPIASDTVDPDPVVTMSRTSGSLFPIGQTPVVVTATDAAGNTVEETFVVTVADTVAPELVDLPDSLLLLAIDGEGTVLSFPKALDSVDEQPSVQLLNRPSTVVPIGSWTVVFRATDRRGNAVEQSVDVYVIDVFPNGEPDAFSTTENFMMTVAGSGVLANDMLPAPLFTADLVDGPTHGNVELQPDGSFVYLPDKDFVGSDGFRYRIVSGDYESEPIGVVLTVRPVYDVRIAESGGGTTVSEDGTVSDSFTVVLTAQPTSDVVLTVSSADTGEATVNPTTLTFTAANWSTPQTVNVSGVDDDLVDGNQTTLVTVRVVDTSSASEFDNVADQAVSVTTTNDDAASLAIRDGASNEDRGLIEFTIELDRVADVDVTVNYATIPGTATTDDYETANGTVTIPSGQLRTSVSIATIADSTFELNEEFAIQLSGLQSSGRNITISTPTAIGTIQNNDIVHVSIDSATQSERLRNLVFAVHIDSPLEIDFSIDYATMDQTASSTDYAQSSGTITFLAGATSSAITIEVTPDNVLEPDETFLLTLNPNGNASQQIQFINSTAIGTIIDDDIDEEIAQVQSPYANPQVINGNFRTVLNGNFDGVGFGDDDLLFWDPVSGQTRLVLGNGAFQDNVILPNSINGNDFFEAIVGDFDGGGGDDLFFWNPFTGKNRLFHTNAQDSHVSTTFETDIIPRPAINGNDFQHFVVADFDGSGPEDLFFWSPLSGKNRLVHMDVVQAGLQSRGDNFQNDIIGRPLLNGGDFETVHAGQFDGDGISELLFFNLRTGKNRIISLDVATPGVESVFSSQVTNNLDPKAFNGSFYKELEIADVNGDGIDDVFTWRPGPGDNRVGLVDFTPNATGQVRSNFLPRNSINGEFSQVVRLTDKLFSSDFRDELFFWDPITGKNRLGHL